MMNFRVTERETDLIRRRADALELSVSGYLLTMALKGQIIHRPGLQEAAHELRKIGNSINLLTRLCHAGRITCPKLDEAVRQLGEIWRSLNSPIPKAD